MKFGLICSNDYVKYVMKALIKVTSNRKAVYNALIKNSNQ